MIQVKNGDCLKLMKKLPDNSVDFILTDLPFGILDYAADKKIDLAEMWQEFRRILKPRCVVALFASGKFTIELAASNMEWYKYKWVWEKNYTTNFVHAKNRPMSKYEEILIFSDGVIAHKNQTVNRMKYFPQGLKPCNIIKGGDSRGKFGRTYHKSPSNLQKVKQEFTNYPTDILKIAAPFNIKRSHPNEKPVELLEYLIKTYTEKGETVLDATMGSGSTAVAAINTGRNFIGYELDDGYFDIACERIRKALRDNTARLF